jgi:hypothetical protein
MPDQLAPISLIQNSFASGELSPGLWGRQDVAKVTQGAAVMRNFFVDYKGGASTRPGTQFIGNPATPGYARLIPFQFSAAIGQTYMLVFSNLRLRFIKNPGGFTYPNSSNAAYILSAGVPYEIVTPYVEADLPYLKVSQVGDQMRITRHGYARRLLTRIADTNWTLTTITANSGPAAPVITSITSSAVIAPDPGDTRYMYVVTAVDSNGNESFPSTPFISGAALNLALSQGTVSVFWSPSVNALFYRVYKALPTPGGRVPSFSDQVGFAGYTYGTSFVDNNIIPDFTLAPPSANDPFANSKIIGYTITGSSADWPVGATTITVTDGTGTGAVVYPILNNNIAGGVGSITGLYIVNGGQNYTAPTLTAVGAGGTVFTATAILGPATGNDPDVVGLFQQRQVYASTTNNPLGIFASRPASFNDFRITNPTVDNDAYVFTIASQQINDIVWLQSMPGGLVVGSNSGIVQLTGGSSNASNPTAVTPTSAVVVPQSFYGAADIHPIVIDYDILYVQSEGSIIRDLQYNFFVNIYTGTDVTILSSHLFYPLTIRDWTYQDAPFKVIWSARDDGVFLSLTWLKAQEIAGWARHDTQGLVESMAAVREGSEDAVYLSVNRGGSRHIERMADRIYYQIDDAWCLDSALSTVSNYPAADITLSGSVGTVTVLADAAVFAPGDVGKVIRAVGAKAQISQYLSPTQVNATVIYPFGGISIVEGGWRMDPVVSTVSGLTHLNGNAVYALVDGAVQGPFTVAAGSITLTTPGSQVVVGLLYQCQIQALYLDIEGQNTIQGRLKKNVAATLRVKDAARIKFGTSFATVREYIPGVSSTDPAENLGSTGTGMLLGDIRAFIDPIFDRVGSVCIQQDYPLPCTLLALIPETVQGDTR